jgi:MFS family permease
MTTDIPARLDRLPWSRFHMLIVIALGVTWVLDGLEVTIVGAIGPVLQETGTLGLTAQEIGGTASAYVVGAVCGALVFGWLTDRFGRKFVFYVTLLVYLAGVLLTATSWSFWSFAIFRVITGQRRPGIKAHPHLLRRACGYALANKDTTPGPLRVGWGTGRLPELPSTRRWRQSGSRTSGAIKRYRSRRPTGVGPVSRAPGKIPEGAEVVSPAYAALRNIG